MAKAVPGPKPPFAGTPETTRDRPRQGYDARERAVAADRAGALYPDAYPTAYRVTVSRKLRLAPGFRS